MVHYGASLHGPQRNQSNAPRNLRSADISVLQGYEADNANILLLRLRSFTIGRPISDHDMLAPDAQDRIVALVGVMEPFVSPS
jgi:uncharacterized protein (DUF2461 family)